MEVLVFPVSYKNVSRHVRPNLAVFVDGRLNLKEQRPKIIVEEITPIEEARTRFTRSLAIDIVSLGLESDILEQLKAVLKKHRGDKPVYLNVSTKKNGSYRILVDRDLYVTPTSAMVEELEELIGHGHIKFEA
ncbi:MAG TPA: hypothetical protein ENN16_00880 [Candidatus Omnitrophica bacterium]|nr:hypothetical protein [Candidatus Omnitrophota bacterium]